MLAAHADWSTNPAKRWLCCAKRCAGRWQVAAPALLGEAQTLFVRLLEQAGGAPVALGVDFPLGLPRAYVAKHIHALPDFPAFLARLKDQAEFFTIAERPEEISPMRPFYPARSRAGVSREEHAKALGLHGREGLSRACDRATAERPAGAPPFWTLGANQSGKAAVHAWQFVLVPALTEGMPIRLWPFAGPFRSLLAPRGIAIAETYPAECMRHLGLLRRGSKRRQADRALVAGALFAALDRLQAVPERALAAEIEHGFGRDAAGEDRFDSLIGLLGVLNVLAGHRPDTAPADPWIQRWEGWVLGQTALPRTWPDGNEELSPLLQTPAQTQHRAACA